MISVLESIINSFGIASFFKPAENDWDADMKGNKLLSLFGTFSMLSAALIAVVDVAICGIIVGSILFTIAALSIIYPCIRPTPTYLPGAENWSRQIQKGELIVEEGRKPILDEIAHLLVTDSKVTTHPLLIGKSGVGKTETVKAFSQAVERGDYPELYGKKVFYFNSASLVNHTEMFGNGNRILSKINEAIGSNRDNVILVFDEIHLTCQKKENSDIAEQLKTLLDSGPRSFPHVIGITTEEEFYRDIFIDNAAFARRFKRINIDNTTEQETLEILSNHVLAHASNIILADDSLNKLIQKVQEHFTAAPEPATSLKILSKCIQRTAESQDSELETRIKEIEERIRFFSSQGAVGRRASILPYQRDPNVNMDQLTRQLQELQEQLRAHMEELSKFYKKREAVGTLKNTMFRTILKVSNFERTALSERNRKELNTFLLLSHFLLPAMENNIQEEAHRLGVLTVIDSDLIDHVIAEELENDRKVQEAVARGKAQITECENTGSPNAKESEEIVD
jgi:ATP-dependent Clp protease ATP-binding subunit ClpA